MATEFHPRWYRRRVSTYWWLGRWPYTRFILRELTSLFVAWAVVLTLLLLRSLSAGPQAMAEFQEWLRAPALLALNGVSLLAVIYHSITWFNLAPSAMAVRVRGKRVPDAFIAAPNYVGWFGVSAVVVWFLFRG